MEIEYGCCQCGCGEKTSISSHTRSRRGITKGDPVKFIKGHASRIDSFNTKRKNLKDKTFGKLTVTGRADNNKFGQPMWNCICECGNYKKANGAYLRDGTTSSCGCDRNNHEGLSGTKEFSMYYAAKTRAQKKGVPFSIEMSDIVIPGKCPYLDIPIILDNTTMKDNSPSLDKIIPDLGYVKGNIEVISIRANRIKDNASAIELRMMADRLELITSGSAHPTLLSDHKGEDSW